MSEAEALARGGAYSLEGPDVQSPPGEPCWMIWRLPISSSSEIDGHQQNNTGEFPITSTGNQSLLPVYALLVLGWTSKDGSDCLSATAKSRLIFPLVADLAGMVIANLLLAERVHELETSTNRHALREMELLKAELLATVNHELRSPLSSIKGYAATLVLATWAIRWQKRRL